MISDDMLDQPHIVAVRYGNVIWITVSCVPTDVIGIIIFWCQDSEEFCQVKDFL